MASLRFRALVPVVFVICLVTLSHAQAQSRPQPQQPEHCSRPQGGVQTFICETPSLWTSDAVLEWELEAAVAALAGTGKLVEMETLKSRATQWQKDRGKGCHWNLPVAEMRKCLQDEFDRQSNDIVSLLRSAGLNTPEMVEAERRASERNLAERRAAESAAQRVQQEIAAAQAKFDAEVATLKSKFDAQRREKSEESRRNLLYLLGAAALGLLACLALYLSLRGRDRSAATATEVGSPGPLPSAVARWALYLASAAAVTAAAALYLVLQGDSAWTKESSSPMPAAPTTPAQDIAPPPGPVAIDSLGPGEMRKIKIEGAIAAARRGTPLCQAYGRNLEVRWRLFESVPSMSVATLYEVLMAGESSGCWR